MDGLEITDIGLETGADFEGFRANPQAMKFERERFEAMLMVAKEHLAKLRGLRVQGPWLGVRIKYVEAEIRRCARILNVLNGLIGEAPRHLVR